MADGLGGSRLKKLFRTSKSAAIDPLPIPDNLTPPNAPLQQPQPSRLHDPPRRRLHGNNNVTPFPVDVGHQQPQAQLQQQHQQPDSTGITPTSTTTAPHHVGSGPPPVLPPPRPSRDLRGPPPQAHTPTLAEIQAIQQAQLYDDVEHAAPIFPVRSRRGTDSSSIEVWLGSTQPQRAQLGNSADVPYASPYGSQQLTPPSSQQQPFHPLPPGAASTPPTRLNHMSQNSLHNIPTLSPPQVPGYSAELDAYAVSRGRGYSSASQSGRGSDHEGALSTIGGGGPGHLGGMLSKPPREATQTRTSPLVQSYSSDLTKSHPAVPEQLSSPQKPKKEKQSFWKRVGDRKSKDTKEAKNKDTNAAVLDRVPSPIIGQPLRPGSMEIATRPSVEDLNEGSNRPQPPQSTHGHGNPQPIPGGPHTASTHGHTSSTGHGFEESRLRVHGMDLNLRMKRDAGHHEGDVSAEIRALCGTRSTTLPKVLEMCERVNTSEHSELIGREAARSIYKVFKNGNDQERRMTARVWLIAMGNITAKDFHRHATSRKMLGAIERILKKKTEPPPSSSTYRRVMEIVSGVTYTYHANSSCEHLLELWNNVRRPEDPEFGTPLPDDYLPIQPIPQEDNPPAAAEHQERTEFPRPVITSMAPQKSPLPSPSPSILSRPPSEPLSRGVHSVRSPGNSPPQLAIPYASMVDHDVDMRRLFDECTSALATANDLHTACVFTRPRRLETDSTLPELQRKALRMFDALNSQMAWAQSEAEKSRRIANSVPRAEQGSLSTTEESALEILLKAHGRLSETLAEYDDLVNRSIEERELREVQERSKTDTRRDYTQQMDMLMAPNEGMATSSSRSPSPSHTTRVQPDTGRSPRTDSGHGHSSYGSHVDSLSIQVASYNLEPKRSRSPSPARGLPIPPKISMGQSPPRSGSPQSRVSRVPGPRPLPLPGAQQFRSVNSNPNLVLSATEYGSRMIPRRGDSGSSGDIPRSNGNADVGEEGDTPRPSRKALGKRRAVIDEDNDFDPNEMFLEPKPRPDASRDDSADSVAKPEIKYVYDAWEEANREKREAKEAEEAAAAATTAVPAKNTQPTSTVHSPATPALSAPIVSAR